MSILVTILKLLPYLFGAIKSAEDFFGAKTGKQKKAAVMGAASAALAGVNAAAKIKEVDSPEEQAVLLGAIDTTIDAIVAGANVVGLFRAGRTTGADVGDATASGGR